MRVQHWQTNYHKGIATARMCRFQWGVHDCITFAAYMVDLLTDLDVTPKFQAKYKWTSAMEAARIIDSVGGLEYLVSEFLGQPVPPLLVHQGDIALCRNGDGRDIVAVHDGYKLLAPTEPEGLRSLPLPAILKGWNL